MGKHYEPPKKTGGDALHDVAKVALAPASFLGIPASELFASIVAPPIERRRNEWMEQVGSALQDLEKSRGIVLEELGENDAFVDVVFQATKAALCCSHEEKRRALQNAILNSALPGTVDPDLQYLFVSYIDRFSGWHLRILKLFNNPEEWFVKHDIQPPRLSLGALSHLIENVFPALAGQREFYDLVWNDLNGAAFVDTDNLHVTMSGGGLVAGRTTEIGKLFLLFIEEPEGIANSKGKVEDHD